MKFLSLHYRQEFSGKNNSIFSGNFENNFSEKRIIFKNSQEAISVDTFNTLDSNNDQKINSEDKEFSGKSSQDIAIAIHTKAAEALKKFYDSVSPEGVEKGNVDRVRRFQNAVKARLPNLDNTLESNRATEIFNEYLQEFKNFEGRKTTTANEALRKAGGTLPGPRLTSVPDAVQNDNRYKKVEITTGEENVQSIIDKKGLIEDGTGAKIDISGYKNVCILDIGNGKPLMFKTGIVSMKPIITNGVVTGFTALDGDGDKTSYNYGEVKSINEYDLHLANQKSSARQKHSAIKNSYAEYREVSEILNDKNKSDLLKKVQDKITDKIKEFHKKNKKIDWNDHNKTIFYEENGKIRIDTTGVKGKGFDAFNEDFLSKKEIEEISGFDKEKLGVENKAINIKNFLNKNQDLLWKDAKKLIEKSQRNFKKQKKINQKKLKKNGVSYDKKTYSTKPKISGKVLI